MFVCDSHKQCYEQPPKRPTSSSEIWLQSQRMAEETLQDVTEGLAGLTLQKVSEVEASLTAAGTVSTFSYVLSSMRMLSALFLGS